MHNAKINKAHFALLTQNYNYNHKGRYKLNVNPFIGLDNDAGSAR